nr:hypothetical protein [uncultured bacterium]
MAAITSLYQAILMAQQLNQTSPRQFERLRKKSPIRFRQACRRMGIPWRRWREG